MCLIWQNIEMFFSPLEQFEINSFNTTISYLTTFPIEIFENNFYNYVSLYSIIDVLFIISLVIFFQTLLKQQGYLYLFIFINILLIGFNFVSFYDILIKNFYLNIDLITFQSPFNAYIESINEYKSSYNYITLIIQYTNIYTVSLCFFFTYCVIYLIYNKMLSNNTNTIIPTLYQILAENLYKLSLNLFYSILGKHISIPEFFIKINTIFIFLVISNVQGMIPYISTLTSALTNTFYIALALFISIWITLLDKKGINYFLNLFMPSGCPILLSLLIIPIEVISYSFRIVSLSVRLFANMMAGHTLLKVIVGFSWIIIFLGNTWFINLFPILILFILTLLEFGVAIIQAYIFTVLSCIYLRDIFEGH